MGHVHVCVSPPARSVLCAAAQARQRQQRQQQRAGPPVSQGASPTARGALPPALPTGGRSHSVCACTCVCVWRRQRQRQRQQTRRMNGRRADAMARKERSVPEGGRERHAGQGRVRCSPRQCHAAGGFSPAAKPPYGEYGPKPTVSPPHRASRRTGRAQRTSSHVRVHAPGDIRLAERTTAALPASQPGQGP